MKKSDKINQLKAKIESMRKGLNSEHISDQMKDSIRTSIKTAEDQLNALESPKAKAPSQRKAKNPNAHLKSLKPEDVFSAWGPTGLSYSDKTREEHGDYKKIAHISSSKDNRGKITWYVEDHELNLPAWLLKEIHDYHIKFKIQDLYLDIEELSELNRMNKMSNERFSEKTSEILRSIKMIEEENGVFFEDLYLKYSGFLPKNAAENSVSQPEDPNSKNKSGFSKKQYQEFRDRYDSLSDQFEDYEKESPEHNRLVAEMEEIEAKINAYERNYKFKYVEPKPKKKFDLKSVDQADKVTIYNTLIQVDGKDEEIAEISKLPSSAGEITWKLKRSIGAPYLNQIESLADKMKEEFSENESFPLLEVLSDVKNILPSVLTGIYDRSEWLWENTTDSAPNNSIVLFALKHIKAFRKKFAEHFSIELTDEGLMDEINTLFKIISNTKKAADFPNENLRAKLYEIYHNAVLKAFVPASQLKAMRSGKIETNSIVSSILNTPIIREGTENFHLHYFSSSSDFFIKEIDFGTGTQDYGYSVLNQDWQMSEYGYISISELLKIPDLNLDLHFTEKNLSEITAFYNAENESGVPKIYDNQDVDKYSVVVSKLTNSALCQIIIDFGLDIEILDIDEVIDKESNSIHISFELHRKLIDTTVIHDLEYSLDIDESLSYFKPMSGFVFVLPKEFNVDKFVKENLKHLDSRTQNTIYSFSKFLTDHSEEIVGKKVAAKTFKNLDPEAQKKLKSEYNKKSSEIHNSNSENKEKTGRAKLKLTKFLKAHGVTQEMINRINKTGEGESIKNYRMPKTGSIHDKKRFAMRPGKRVSANGKIYYELRPNRSDSGNKGL